MNKTQLVDEVAKVLLSKQLFRVGNPKEGHLQEVERFEQEWAEKIGAKRVFPTIDTNFIGAVQEKGLWLERCQTCGDCERIAAQAVSIPTEYRREVL